MSKRLGFYWYPENWWTSDAFFDLEEKPILKYLYLEILFLLYMNHGEFKITESTLYRRFRVKLSDSDFRLLEGLFIVEDGVWTSESVKKRMSRAETARENGKKGGRPKKQKTQKPTNKPSLIKKNIKVRENVSLKESEIESLKQKYSDSVLEKIYDKLDNYKLSSGKKYKSDYGAINSWVAKSITEESKDKKSLSEKISEARDIWD